MHVQKHLCHSGVSSAVLSDPADPSEVVLNLGVDARVVGVGAADAPRYNAFKFSVTDKRSSRVSLMRRDFKKSVKRQATTCWNFCCLG